MTFPAEILAKVPEKLRLDYQAYQPEVQAIRKRWAGIRKDLKSKPLVEHNMLTREYHQVERNILAYLVPDLNARDAKTVLKAMKWILKQPWGEDFRPGPIEKKFRGVELGSSHTSQPG